MKLSSKSFFTVLFVVFFFASFSVKAYAADYSSYTNDELINKAISLVEPLNNGESINVLKGQNSTHKQVSVKFANLSAISIDYMNAHAVTIIDENGRMAIYIDKKLKNSPPEALACLLVHETTHSDSVSSIDEEVVAWTREAAAWTYFVQKKPSLVKESQNALVLRENYLSKLYKANGNSGIRREVLANSGYTSLTMVPSEN